MRALMPIGNLENLQEEAVMKAIREMLDIDAEFAGGKVCTCHDCIVDIAAIALNHLPPQYVADRFYKFPDSPKLSEERLSQVSVAVRDAIRKVAKNPHH